MRFTLAYAALLAGTGAALVAAFYVFIGVAGFVRPGTRPTTTEGDGEIPAIAAAEPADPLLANVGFIAIVVTIVALAMWTGWLIAGRLLRPLQTIDAAARRVGHGDVSTRVRLRGPDDEFAHLATVLNSMLDRIQQSLDAYRRFAANASHELQTPLAASRAMLSVALDAPAETDFVALARRLNTVNEHSIATVEALLDLSDTDQPLVDAAPADLAEVAREQLDLLAGAADGAGLTVTRRLRPAPVLGNRVLLARVVANLVQNAVRHNRTAGAVVVRTGSVDDESFLEVANTGPIVDPDDIGTLTEPFVRRRGRAAGPLDGHGLGLAIVASVVRAHRARLGIVPRAEGGLVVRVVFAADDAEE